MNKKILFVLFIIFLFCFKINVLATGSVPYMNLKHYDPTQASNNARWGFIVYNYATYTVNVSDIKIKVFFKAETGKSASDYVWTSYSGNVETRDNLGNWVANLGAFNGTYSGIYPKDCGYEYGVTRQADIELAISYSGTETIPANGGYMQTVADNNAFGETHTTDWINLSYGLFYSCPNSSYDARLSVSRTAAIDNYYIVLYYNNVQHCESINTSGTEDTASGKEPCNTSACGTAYTPTTTPTITSTITETITETATSTVTPSMTETITPTITETITETNTETISPTTTETTTPTITYTPTITNTPTITRTPTNTPTIYLKTVTPIITSIYPVRTAVAVKTAQYVKTPKF